MPVRLRHLFERIRRRAVVRVRSKVIAAVCIVVLLSAAGVGAWVWNGASAPADSDDSPPPTAEVTLGDLSDVTAYRATVSYGEAQGLRPVGGGIFTHLPVSGDVVEAGEELYSVDERPVYAMSGDIPVYRVLEYGTAGQDVRQLKDNLRALGYELTSDSNEFDGETHHVVLQWQKDRGRERTGQLGEEDIAFVPSQIRVDEVASRVGELSDEVPFTYTPNTPVVSASLTTDQARRLAAGVGDPVILTVNGEDVPGTVTSVSVADDGSATIIAVPEEDDVAVDARVELSTIGEERQDVLTVPISAIVAEAGGVYAVEVLRDDRIVDVPVELGLLAEGRIEITSGELSEGDEVVVPE